MLAVGTALALAGADEAVRVAIVTPDASGPMVARIRAELEGLGVAPVVMERTQDIDVAAREAHVVAAVGVLERSLWVWIEPRGATEPLLRELLVRFDDPMAVSVVGVQAVEELRAGLLEVGPERDPSATLPELVAAAEAPLIPSHETRVWVTFGPGVLGASLGTTLGTARLSGVVEPVAGVELVVAVHGTWLPARVGGTAGSANLSLYGGQLGARYRLTSGTADLHVAVGLGVDVSALLANGSAASGFDDHDLVAPRTGGLVDIVVGRALPGPFSLQVRAEVGVSRKTAILFGQQEVRSWGPLTGGLSAEVVVEPARSK